MSGCVTSETKEEEIEDTQSYLEQMMAQVGVRPLVPASEEGAATEEEAMAEETEE